MLCRTMAFDCLFVCWSLPWSHGQIQSSLTLRGRGKCRACQPLLALACLPLAPHLLVQHLALAPCMPCTALCMYSLVSCNCHCLLLHKPCIVGHRMVQPKGFYKQLTSLAFLLVQPLYISNPCSQLLVLKSSSTSLQAHCLVCRGRKSLLCIHQI